MAKYQLPMLMCWRPARMERYAYVKETLIHSRYTLLYNKIGWILCGQVFKVFYMGNKIVAALQRNVREKRIRAQLSAQIMKHILGRYGPERLLELLPYVNGYRLCGLVVL